MTMAALILAVGAFSYLKKLFSKFAYYVFLPLQDPQFPYFTLHVVHSFGAYSTLY
jgi:hypothetical protein